MQHTKEHSTHTTLSLLPLSSYYLPLTLLARSLSLSLSVFLSLSCSFSVFSLSFSVVLSLALPFSVHSHCWTEGFKDIQVDESRILTSVLRVLSRSTTLIERRYCRLQNVLCVCMCMCVGVCVCSYNVFYVCQCVYASVCI
jgi:hypothetical protein